MVAEFWKRPPRLGGGGSRRRASKHVRLDEVWRRMSLRTREACTIWQLTRFISLAARLGIGLLYKCRVGALQGSYMIMIHESLMAWRNSATLAAGAMTAEKQPISGECGCLRRLIPVTNHSRRSLAANHNIIACSLVMTSCPLCLWPIRSICKQLDWLLRSPAV